MSQQQSRRARRALMEQMERRQLLSAAVAAGDGLRAEFFHTTNLTQPAFTRTDASVNFDWANGAPDPQLNSDWFSARWTGQIETLYDETYTFFTTSDDGVRLWIDGKLIIDNWSVHGTTVDSAAVSLTQGLHDIKMTYFDGGGHGVAKLEWASPSQHRQVVPQEYLYAAALPAPESGDGLLGEYFNATNFTEPEFSRTDAIVNFDWQAGSPSSQIDPSTFSIRWTGKIEAPQSGTYTFATTSDDGVRVWIDDTLVIDNWTIHAPSVDFGAIDLAAGQHAIKMEYYQQHGAAVAQLQWAPPGQSFQAVPQKYLYAGPEETPTPDPTPTPSPAPTPEPTPEPRPTPATAPASATPSAGMIVVGPNESVKSIGQAVNMAQPGQTIFIRNGTYREAVTIIKSGQAGRPIILQAQSVGGVTIDAGGKGFGIDGARASFITLKGIKIVNANSGLQKNAALRVGANWVVEDVEVQRAAVAGIYVGGANSTFIRTYARDCGQQGWWVNANNTMLKDSGATGNNTRKYNAAWEAGGVKFYITSGGVVDGGVWANNGGPAIWFDYQNKNFVVKNTEVYGNHGWHQGWAGVGIVSEINAGPGTFENNYVHDNSGDGIAVWEAYGTTIRNNKLVRDTIGFRDLTNRAPYRTRNNQILNNQFFQGQVNNPPGNAGNVVQGNTQVSNSGPPAGW